MSLDTSLYRDYWEHDGQLIPIPRDIISSVADTHDISEALLTEILAEQQADMQMDGVFNMIKYLESGGLGRVLDAGRRAIFLEVDPDPVWKREQAWGEWSDEITDAVQEAHNSVLEEASVTIETSGRDGFVAASWLPVSPVSNLDYDISWRSAGELGDFLCHESGIDAEDAHRFAVVSLLMSGSDLGVVEACGVAGDLFNEHLMTVYMSVSDVKKYKNRLEDELEVIANASILGETRFVGADVFEQFASI